MKQESIRQTRVSLFLISLTFLAMWVEFVICKYITPNMPYRELINLLTLYLFSLVLPAIGLLIFIKNMRRISPRWYWGVPFLVGIILNTFVRDLTFMVPFSPNAVNLFYGQPFLSNFVTFDSTTISIITIFFSVAVALFCLSVPEEKRKKLMLPFALSLIAAFSNMIHFIVGLMGESTVAYYSFFVSSIAVFIVGLFFMLIADTF